MLHLKRRRNLNEFCGAYGHDFTFEEMRWLAHWLLVRGCNLLVPHAFYYSVRGPRLDERPPDVGPHSPWWHLYRPFALATSRLCWLNTDSRPVCELAILGRNDHLPWRAARVCFRRQRDFHYLEARHLWEDAGVDAEGIHLAGMRYRALIVEDEVPGRAREALEILTGAGRVIRWDETMTPEGLVEAIDQRIPPDVQVSPAAPDLRVRHVRRPEADYYLLFNEGEGDLQVRLKLAARGRRALLDSATGQSRPVTVTDTLPLARHALSVLAVRRA